ncbi:MAG: hypothetical protein H8E98_07250, partial [Bacteroidetes bacterium]|nr:hypothetical protein [Bacteroidota bacterium]
MNSTKVITIGFFLMMLLLTGCSSELGSIEKIFDKDGADGDDDGGGDDDDQIEAEVVVIDSEINLKEIAEHGVKGDCWTGVDGMVYDLTAYIALGEHDSKIEMACGV